ncbi:hypothetical protein RGQ15_10335 [Paracoccus sp. MBLB3053]|uniref:Uncharacterized protein n=1 Tax=Paracoccus aurantius TaxID=3073814 RepID=A0ABU2HSF5_9RHOB|nr:hypothetical protein [Paracoccus sp. MBLB3053]MDS9467962.1 hypothetical protein [Paracoccus sp. MBLB3053]
MLNIDPALRIKTERNVSRAFAGCFALHNMNRRGYGDLVFDLTPDKLSMTFGKSTEEHIKVKVRALASLGPIALLPLDEVRRMVRYGTYLSSGVLSKDDMRFLQQATVKPSDCDALIFSTLTFLQSNQKWFSILVEKIALYDRLRIEANEMVRRRARSQDNAV